jgi:hypothetical protein
VCGSWSVTPVGRVRTGGLAAVGQDDALGVREGRLRRPRGRQLVEEEGPDVDAKVAANQPGPQPGEVGQLLPQRGVQASEAEHVSCLARRTPAGSCAMASARFVDVDHPGLGSAHRQRCLQREAAEAVKDDIDRSSSSRQPLGYITLRLLGVQGHDGVRAKLKEALQRRPVPADPDHPAGSVPAGHLDGELADRSGGPEDQHGLSLAQACDLDQRHVGRCAGIADRRGRHRRRPVRQGQHVLVPDNHMRAERAG